MVYLLPIFVYVPFKLFWSFYSCVVLLSLYLTLLIIAMCWLKTLFLIDCLLPFESYVIDFQTIPLFLHCFDRELVFQGVLLFGHMKNSHYLTFLFTVSIVLHNCSKWLTNNCHKTYWRSSCSWKSPTSRSAFDDHVFPWYNITFFHH